MDFRRVFVLVLVSIIAPAIHMQAQNAQVQALGNRNVMLLLSKDDVEVNAVNVDAENNIYAVGTFSDRIIAGTKNLSSTGGKDIFLVSVDNNMQTRWVKKFGGKKDEFVNALNTEEDGSNYIMMTYTGETTIAGSNITAQGTKDVLLLKMNEEGTVIQQNSLQISGNPMGEDMAVAKDGSVFMLVSFQGELTMNKETYEAPDEEEGALLVKMNKEGGLSWVKELKGIQKDSRIALGLGANDELYVSGTFSRVLQIDKKKETANGGSDVFLAKFDKNGKIDWLKRSRGEGAEAVRDIGIASDGSVYLTGSFKEEVIFDTENEAAAADQDIFLVKYSDEGSVMWLRAAKGGFQNDNSSNLVVTTRGNVYLTGTYTGNITFYDQTLAGVSGKEAFIASYGSKGMLNWLKQAGGSGIDRGVDIALTGDDQIIVIGEFSGEASFSGTPMKSLSGTDGFIWKF